ncbi:MAG TPA: hypothetical protein VMS17_05800 [Gemmataceae bacterium]|nr:hypothetical protein [Gemmataceae bacterium]
MEHETTRSPRGEYEHRQEDRRRRAAQLAWRERLLGNGRFLVFLIGLGMAALAFGMNLLSGWWLLAPVAVFSVLLLLHENVTRDLRRASQAVTYYRDGLARLAGEWIGKGRQGQRFLDEKHAYAADLDLFGSGSLFELLCTARTRTGEETLAGWLLHPASAAEIQARQAAVAELRPQLDLREDLALLGADMPVGVDFDAVASWGAAPPSLPFPAPGGGYGWGCWPRWIALVLGVLTVICAAGWALAAFHLLGSEFFFGWFFSQFRSLPFLVLLAVEGALAGALLTRVRQVLEAVEKRGRDLAMLARVLARLERGSFTSPRLRDLRERLNAADGVPPSQRIARLGSLIDSLNQRRNLLFAPVAYLLLWGAQHAYAFEAWRAASGKAVADWLRAVGEFEALCSLASYSFENPDDPFPEMATDAACYDGDGLRHPLLPNCVPNDLHLTGELRVLIVSGSNMSGKSTFLRTVGVNAVLALAGAPVRARRLRLSPLAAGATLRIQDSLQEGRSRFYAEVLRVRQLVDLSRGPLPLLFLLDEIFAGTNSHDRRIGAESVVRGLVDAGAVGLVTTHDLSLTHIAEQLGPRAANVHFADHFENGVMTFDYRLQPGVVRHSNALALMRAVGLDV